ncbi:pilus assembly protein CpaB [Aliiroseovarius sediminilitoris]|uniref:Pilus assembly protein CpaB n=1 Tax=Aliiroseovarius sediminilitoris TaxID=1173584 RepID=A0A1I0P657_9RHOB|nr:Flp pilus assembly protein CpaB [Aliiroseovarius sediminilitoris]SEW09558.1 pilus assembly protein CpaB [Aliiroseovarius sediminilitoris]
MRLLFGLVLIIGVGLAGFAVYMAKDYIGDFQTQLDAERAARAAIVPTVDVFVVNRPLRYGEQMTADDIRAVKWPENAIPEGTFGKIEDIFPDGEKKFRTVLRAMEKDEALLEVKVTKPGADAGVSSRLATGMRAYAINVDVSSGVSGFLRPEDRIDVYWSGRGFDELGEGQAVTKLILANVHIIAVDQIADTDRTGPTIARTITVEVTPRQVAALAQAQSSGRLSLALVGTQDETVTSSVEVGQGEIMGEVVGVQEEVCTIRTRRGGEIIETQIACPE